MHVRHSSAAGPGPWFVDQSSRPESGSATRRRCRGVHRRADDALPSARNTANPFLYASTSTSGIPIQGRTGPTAISGLRRATDLDSPVPPQRRTLGRWPGCAPPTDRTNRPSQAPPHPAHVQNRHARSTACFGQASESCSLFQAPAERVRVEDRAGSRRPIAARVGGPLVGGRRPGARRITPWSTASTLAMISSSETRRPKDQRLAG